MRIDEHCSTLPIATPIPRTSNYTPLKIQISVLCAAATLTCAFSRDVLIVVVVFTVALNGSEVGTLPVLCYPSFFIFEITEGGGLDFGKYASTSTYYAS